MRAISFIRCIAFQHCVSTLENLGYDAEGILERACIPQWQLGAPLDLVPVHDFVRVLELGAKTIGDPSFGSIVGQNNPMKFSRFSNLIARSVSLFDACQKSAKFINLLNSGSYIWVSCHPDYFRICRSKPPDWQSEQYVLQHLVGLARMGAGPNWRPKDVYITQHQTNNLEKTDLFADANFHLGFPYLAIDIPQQFAGSGIKYVDVAAGSGDETKLRKNMAPRDFIGSVCKAIEIEMPHKSPDIGSICELIGVSKRTFQRELAKEGEVYRNLVGRVRFKQSRCLLADTDMPVKEIAHELGYSCDTQFVRAFSRWTGVTPSVFRRDCKHDGTGRVNA